MDSKRGWWWKPSIEQADQAYQVMLESVAQEDFSDLDDMGFLQVCGDDKRGRPIVMVAARLYQAKVVTQARTLRYLVHKLHSVVQEPYTLLWLHTQSNYWNNCPSTWWLWRTYESLPSVYRTNLMQLHVLHCDLSLWSSVSVALPWYSEGLWSKINWVSRVEFLWDTIDKRVLLPYLPEYVIEHDQDLEEQPLADYGLIASKELATALPGAPAQSM